jgi:FkbM family methyltransferase
MISARQASRNFSKHLINISAKLLPFIFWKNLEIFAQRAQGKGWGATSLSAEIKAHVRIISSLGISNIVALDVGANQGEWSIALIKALPESTIHAFGPSSKAFDLLSQNIKQYDKILSHKIALSDQEVSAPIYFDEEGSGQASLVNRRLEHFGTTWKKFEVVKVTTLDKWLASGPFLKPNVMKLDIEGFELAALKGASKTLEFIKVVQFEFGGTSIDTKVFFQDYWYFFKDLNFDLYRFGPRGLQPINHYSEQDESFSVTNFFAIRKK